MLKDQLSETATALIQEIKQQKLTGPDAARRLLGQGFGLNDAETALRSLGFYALIDPQKGCIAVSIATYEGEVHPRIQDISLNENPNSVWKEPVE